MNVGFISLRYFYWNIICLTAIMISSSALHQFMKNPAGWTIKASVSCKIFHHRASVRERERWGGSSRAKPPTASHLKVPPDCGGGTAGRRHSSEWAAACRANVGPVTTPATPFSLLELIWLSQTCKHPALHQVGKTGFLNTTFLLIWSWTISLESRLLSVHFK